MKQCRNCRGSTSSRRSRVSDGTRPTPYSVSRQNRLVRMHSLVELQKTLHAEHRQAQAIRLIQPSAWIFNGVEASSHFLQQPRSAERLAHAWHSRRAILSGPPPPGGTFPTKRQIAPNRPEKSTKIFFRLYIFQRVRALAGIAGKVAERRASVRVASAPDCQRRALASAAISARRAGAGCHGPYCRARLPTLGLLAERRCRLPRTRRVASAPSSKRASAQRRARRAGCRAPLIGGRRRGARLSPYLRSTYWRAECSCHHARNWKFSREACRQIYLPGQI